MRVQVVDGQGHLQHHRAGDALGHAAEVRQQGHHVAVGGVLMLVKPVGVQKRQKTDGI